MGERATVISQAKPSQAKPSQAKPSLGRSAPFFRCQFRNYAVISHKAVILA